MNQKTHSRQTTLILKKPRITEKASELAAKNVYTFEIDKRVGKKEVAVAVEALYNVKPVKVNISSLPSKTKTRGRHVGKTSMKKKALVFLKDGDNIDFV